MFGKIHPVKNDIVLNLIPTSEKGIIESAFANIKRSILRDARRTKIYREEYAQLITVVAIGSAIIAPTGFFIFTDAYVFFPIDG